MDPRGGRRWHITTDIPDDPLGRRLIVQNHGVVQAPGFVRSVKAEDHDPLVDVSVSRATAADTAPWLRMLAGRRTRAGGRLGP